MKTSILSVVILAFFYSNVMAQNTSSENSDGIKSLISKENEVTGFGGLDFKVGETASSQAMQLGLQGGLLINKHVIIGVGMNGWAIRPEFEGISKGVTDDLELNGGYAGLLLGYKFFPKSIVHINVPILLGGGQMEVVDDDYFELYSDDGDYAIEDSGFLVVDSSMQLEINVSNSLRLALGAGYRFVNGTNLSNLDDHGLSDFYTSFSVLLGKF